MMHVRHLVAAGLMTSLLAGCVGRPVATTPSAATDTSDGGGRIINGKEADYGTAPWQVFLEWNPPQGRGNSCGAVLIRAEWVLTARHCVQGSKAAFNEATAIRAITLSAGHLFVGGGAPPEDVTLALKQTRRVDRVHVAPGWEVRKSDNFKLGDLALLHVSKPFEFKTSLRSPRPIRLPTADASYPQGEGQISGWGRTRWTSGASSGELSKRLLYAEVDILPQGDCAAATGFKSAFPAGLVCAWKQSSGRNASTSCQGDSGGPLVLMGGEPVLVGLVSAARGCGTHAAVFTRVSAHSKWINAVMDGTAQ